MGHELNAAASDAAPHSPASFPCRSSRVEGVSSSQRSGLIAAAGSLILRNFSLQRGAHFVGNVVKPETHALPRIAVDHLGVANDLHLFVERYAHHEKRALRNVRLSVHVEST